MASAASDARPPPDGVLLAPIRAATPVRAGRTGEDRDVAMTTSARLRATLDRVVAETLELTRGIGVRRLERDLGMAAILTGADFYFEKLTAPQHAAQMKVKRRFDTFSEIVRVLLRAAPETLVSQWKEATERFREAWVELGTNYALSPDRARNEAALRKDAAALEHILSVFEVGEAGVLIVPDTNSLVDQPDPAKYRAIAGRDDFTPRPPAAGARRTRRAQDRAQEPRGT